MSVYPRVLIISAVALNMKSATGMTMANLFHGWPLESIAQVYWDETSPDHDVCNRYWVISHKNAPMVHFVRRIMTIFKSKWNSFTPAWMKTANISPSHPPGRRIYSPGIATAWADTFPVQLSDEFWQWIDDFKPEVIYSVLGSIRIMNIVNQVSKKLSIPIVPHFMDDWPSTLYHSEIFNYIPRQILKFNLNKILKKSRQRIVISDAMAEEFSSRYQKEFTPFMNCVEVNFELETSEKSNSSPVIFCYIGGLHLNRWRSLQQVADALSQIKDCGKQVELVIFAPAVDLQKYGHLFTEKSAIRLGGSLSPDEVVTTLCKFDVLVHIESFDEMDRQYTRLSISTKIPQYMAVGKPILAYGPAEIASCKYVKLNHAGLVVGKRDSNSLSVAITSLIESSELRKILGINGRNTSIAKHNAIVERDKFKSLLAYCPKF